jgi:hypothetical protein
VEKRKERVEGIEKCREFLIFFIYILLQNPLNLEKLKKLYLGRVFEGLYEFFKFNLSCYKIH